MSRVALVTGASRGIGRATAELLASQGFRVAVNYSRSAAAAEEVVAKIEAAGGEAIAVAGDVGEETAVATLFEEIGAAFGAVEVLVNNAGVTKDNLLVRMGVDEWDEVIRVNLRSAYLCTKAAMRGMLRARWGRVVSVSSVAGVGGNAGQANYSAAKAGLIGFTRSIAKEVGSRAITANVVAPGFIETDMTADLDENIKSGARTMIPAGRFGTAREVASLIGYLCSDEAAYISGQVVRVDGGIAI